MGAVGLGAERFCRLPRRLNGPGGDWALIRVAGTLAGWRSGPRRVAFEARGPGNALGRRGRGRFGVVGFDFGF